MKLHPDVLADMKTAKEGLYRDHRDDPNFTGCGIGFRRKNGKVTDEVVVIAMVRDKLPAGAVSRRRLLPATVSNGDTEYGVDVVEVGRVRAAGDQQPEPTGGIGGPYIARYTPPIQGSSISLLDPDDYPSNTAHGTFGCLVRDTQKNNAISVLSANHVIAEIDQASAGAAIIQPGWNDNGTSANTFATLTRTVPLEDGASVDAAIAKLTDQSNYSQQTVNTLMNPISVSHPAVGMAVGWDTWGNCFLTRMDYTLEQLGCELLPATASDPCCVEPEIGVNIDKVGRTSGYTSSTIDAIAVQVSIDFPGVDTVDYQGAQDTVSFTDMIWTQYFFVDGDSGAVACVGGPGDVFVLYPPAPQCELLGAAQTYYALPATTSDNTLTNSLQSQFLSQCQTGNLFIGAVYLNKDSLVGRLQQDTGTGYAQPTAQSAAQAFYGTYRDLIAAELAGSSDATITPDNAHDAVNLVLDVTGYAYDEDTDAYAVTGPYSLDEAQAVYILTYLLGEAMAGNGTDPGMTMDEASAYLDQGNVYNIAYNTLVRVPTIVLP